MRKREKRTGRSRPQLLLPEKQPPKIYGILWRMCLYAALLTAMVAGRLVWGVAEVVLLGLGGNAFTAQAFLAGALLNAVPGILVQLILIPAVMAALQKANALEKE